MLAAALAILHRIMTWFFKKNGIGKSIQMRILLILSVIFVKGQKKITKKLSKHIQSSGRQIKQAFENISASLQVRGLNSK